MFDKHFTLHQETYLLQIWEYFEQQIRNKLICPKIVNNKKLL